MYCEKCGKKVNEGASFCVECGADLRSLIVPVERTGPADKKLYSLPGGQKAVMIIFAALALLFSVSARFFFQTYGYFPSTINGAVSSFISNFIYVLPSLGLLITLIFLNGRNAPIMVIPLGLYFFFDIALDFVLYYRHVGYYSSYYNLTLICEFLFIVFTILAVTIRNTPLKVLSIISLSLYKTIVLFTYIRNLVYLLDRNVFEQSATQVLFFFATVFGTVAWYVFLFSMKNRK